MHAPLSPPNAPYRVPDPLVTRVMEGDHAALGALFDRDAPWVYGLALRFVDAAAAADITHTVFDGIADGALTHDTPGLGDEGAIIAQVRALALAHLAERRAAPPRDHPGLPQDGGAFEQALGHLSAADRHVLADLFWRGAGAPHDRAALRRSLVQLEGALSQRLRTQPESPDGLDTAELFLGTLPDPEAAVLRQRLAHDDALTAVSGAWTEALSHLARPLSRAKPPAGLRKRVLGRARRGQLSRIAQDLDLIPTVIGVVIAMLVAAGLLWVTQGGLDRGPDTLRARITVPVIGTPGLDIAYAPETRRIVFYPDGDIPDDVQAELRIGADTPIPLGPVAPAPQMTVAALPDDVPADLEGTVIVILRGDREVARAALSAR